MPATLADSIQAIVVGDPWSAESTVLAPHRLSNLPPATITPGPGPAGQLLPAGAAFPFDPQYEEVEFDVTVHGYVQIGDCVGVFSRVTLTAGEPDTYPPDLSIIVGGRRLIESAGCDATSAVAAGYGALWEPLGAVGDTGQVFAMFEIPAGLGAPQAIVVGHTVEPEPPLVAAPELPAIPAVG